MEMAEERIAERIDANMMNIPLDDLELHVATRITSGRWHASSEHVCGTPENQGVSDRLGHTRAMFRALLQELKLKQNFTPDVLMVDYMTICSSARIKMGSTVNSYTLYKFVSEELRGLGVEFELPVWTAAQFNRRDTRPRTRRLPTSGSHGRLHKRQTSCSPSCRPRSLKSSGRWRSSP
jgi:replicative DNA helicase